MSSKALEDTTIINRILLVGVVFLFLIRRISFTPSLLLLPPFVPEMLLLRLTKSRRATLASKLIIDDEVEEALLEK
jgi:hypothetical protein